MRASWLKAALHILIKGGGPLQADTLQAAIASRLTRGKLVIFLDDEGAGDGPLQLVQQMMDRKVSCRPPTVHSSAMVHGHDGANTEQVLESMEETTMLRKLHHGMSW